MREAQLRNLETRVRSKVGEIEQRRRVSVSIRPLAGGYVEVG
jgi:hypothetical protein